MSTFATVVDSSLFSFGWENLPDCLATRLNIHKVITKDFGTNVYLQTQYFQSKHLSDNKHEKKNIE